MLFAYAESRRQSRLARSRPPIEPDEFIARLARGGVSEPTAAFVLESFAPYYQSRLTPEPDDHVTSTMRIDPEDMEDIAAAYWERFDIPPPSSADPVLLPDDPSLVAFGLWLDRHAEAAR